MRTLVKIEILAACCVIAAALFFPAFLGEQHAEKTILLMDTVVKLSANGAQAEEAIEESLQRLQELDTLLQPKSEELERISRFAGKQPVKISPELFHILEVSQEYSKRTDGAWDVTAGKLVELWGIGTEHAKVPSEEEISVALQKVGWQHLQLDAGEQTAFLEIEGMKLDLGGIAKGYAADEVRRIYEQHGIKSGLINLGASSIYAVGQKEHRPWRIGIRHPRSENADTCLAVIPLSDAALSTSGDYERTLEENGKKYHHILNPKTGYPADEGIISNTIIVSGTAKDVGMLSDLLTTAVFVMGRESGKAFLETLPPEIQGAITSNDGKVLAVHKMSDKMEQIAEDFTLIK